MHIETEIDAKVAAKNAFCSMGQHCSSEVRQQRPHVGPLQQGAQEPAGSLQSSLMCQAADGHKAAPFCFLDCSPCQQNPGSGSQGFVCSQGVVTQTFWEAACNAPDRGREPICISELPSAEIISSDWVASPENASSHGDKAKRQGHCQNNLQAEVTALAWMP